jgi:hypothetical protein
MNFIKRAAVRVAVGALAVGAATVAVPIAAQAVTITGSGTSVTFSGTGGDFITGDQAWSYDPSSSIINATVSSDSSTVTVDISGDDGVSWEVDFAAPQGQALTAGTVYDNAARYPFQSTTQPGLSLFGDGRGCDTVTGSFTVKSATFGPNGWIQSFDATFVQNCEGSTTSAATGEVVLNNGPAPAELAVAATPAATASVSHVSGQAVITGTVTCNRAVTVDLSGTLDQRLTRTVLATGTWSADNLTCTTTPTAWSATVQPQGNVPFGDGHAQVSGTYSSFDPVFQITVTGTFSQGVKLSSS